MAISFWEFRSESIEPIHGLAQLGLANEIDPTVALAKIEQICMEGALAFDGEGVQVEDDELREKLAEHYGEPRQISWYQR